MGMYPCFLARICVYVHIPLVNDTSNVFAMVDGVWRDCCGVTSPVRCFRALLHVLVSVVEVVIRRQCVPRWRR